MILYSTAAAEVPGIRPLWILLMFDLPASENFLGHFAAIPIIWPLAIAPQSTQNHMSHWGTHCRLRVARAVCLASFTLEEIYGSPCCFKSLATSGGTHWLLSHFSAGPLGLVLTDVQQALQQRLGAAGSSRLTACPVLSSAA